MPFVRLTDSLPNLLLGIFGNDRKDFITLSLGWRSIVGDYIADRTNVISMKESVIYIGVTNSVILQELVLLKEDITEKIQRRLSLTVNRLYFVMKDDRKHVKNSSFSSFS
jgi:hypothetical protein